MIAVAVAAAAAAGAVAAGAILVCLISQNPKAVD
jgi:hypothetical protein